MNKSFIFFLTVSVAVLAGLTVLAWTAFSRDARPGATGDSHITIPASAFNENNDNLDFYRTDVVHTVSGSGLFYAPINLPHGSRLKKIVLVCLDTELGDDITVSIQRTQTYGDTNIATVSSADASMNWRTFSQRVTSNNYINTIKYSYYLKLELPGPGALPGSTGYKVSKVRIVYTPPA